MSDDLELLLRAWGMAFGEAPEVEPRSLVPCTLGRFGRSVKPRAAGRSGVSRLRLMAQAAGEQYRVLPKWAVDPVPCCATRAGVAPDFDPRLTPNIELVERAWAALRQHDELQGQVLRVEYHTRGRQSEKAESLGLRLKRYKDALRLARAFVAGRLA